MLSTNVLNTCAKRVSFSLNLIRTFVSSGKSNDYNAPGVKTIKLRTCVGIYDRLRKVQPKLYRDAPSEGIDITIDYLDNLEPNTKPEKTIVAIHGVPGNYTHFDPIPQYFAKKNIRMIVPNMPNFADTRRTKAFWHSTEERCQFLKDFLEKLNVKKIDCLVTHSFGIHPASQFLDQCTDVEIGSFAFFSPNTLSIFDKQSDIQLVDKIFLFRSEWWYNLLSYLKVHQWNVIPMKFKDINMFLLIGTVGFEKQSPIDLPKRIEKLVKNTEKPIVLLYGSRERLVPKQCIQELPKQLGIDPNDIVYIDKEKDTPEKSIRMDKRIMYYNLKDGGHFAHVNFHPFTIRMIENLLNYQKQ